MAFKYPGQAGSPYEAPNTYNPSYNPYIPGTPQPENDIANSLSDEAQAERDAYQQAHRDSAWAHVNADGENLGSYGQVGSRGGGGDFIDPMQSSDMRYDQTVAERTEEQIQNFQYGGYAGGADDAVAAARGAVAPYASALGQYGDQFMGQSAVGAGNYFQGSGGLYGTADALTQYAQQGPGPSLAQAQHEANNAQAMNQQLAIAGSGRGMGGGASAFRQAAANQAQMAGAANAQTAMLRAQEAQDWRNAQLQAYGQAGALYGQGADTAGQYAQSMGSLAAQAQQAAGATSLSGEQLANTIQGTALAGTQGYEQNLTDTYGIKEGVPSMGDPGAMTTKDWLGAGLQTVGTFFPIVSKGWEAADKATGGDGTTGTANSDIRAKTNIKPGSALDAIEDAGGYTYNYLDPGRHGEGTYFGPMAQELEGAPGVVGQSQDGTKNIDTGRLALVNTSAISELNRKVDALTEQQPAKEQPMVPAKGPRGGAKAKGKPKYEVKIGDAQIEEEFGPPLPPAAAPEPAPAAAKPAPASPRPKPAPRLVPEREQPPWPADPIYDMGDGTYGNLPEKEPTPAMRFLKERYNNLREIFEPEEYERERARERRMLELEMKERMGLPTDRPIGYRPPAGGTRPAEFTGDPATLDYLAERYGTPIISEEELPQEESSGSYLDSIFGPNLGDYASDVAIGTKADEELKEHWRRNPQADLFL